MPAAAATAGATVGAEGVIVELGEKASFSVYEPPPRRIILYVEMIGFEHFTEDISSSHLNYSTNSQVISIHGKGLGRAVR
jgi:hypothetical protein